MTALLAPPRRAFSAEASPVPAAVRARMDGVSWHGDDPRCPRWDDLAYLTLDHVTFDGTAPTVGGTARGELVVAAALAGRTIALFRRLWELGFPIRQLRLVDDFAASDEASMAADNSSAFNFRVVDGTDVLSQHALGRAIDLNPVENPWRRPDRLVPAAGAAFADRRELRPGMFVRPGPVVAALDELGWEWGGDWRHAFDDHHLVWSRPL
jgi:D-alanyl-D-alanine carboxypeptidase